MKPTTVEFHVLLALFGGPRPGDAIMREVEELTSARVRIGPGPPYKAIQRLVAAQLDACQSGRRRFALESTGACVCGAVVTALVANGLTSTFSYFYHPYFEGVTLSPCTYRALLGIALGAVQSAVLHRRFPLGVVWLLASAVSTALGLQVAIAVAKIGGPVAYGVVIGTVVGGSQWAVLRRRIRQAAYWVLASTVALSVAMFSCAENMHRTLEGVNPLS